MLWLLKMETIQINIGNSKNITKSLDIEIIIIKCWMKFNKENHKMAAVL